MDNTKMDNTERIYITSSTEYCTIEKHINAPVFKKIFNADKKVRCLMYVSVVGLYRCFLNGIEITKGFLSPFINNPDDVVYYDEYDISLHVKEKNNVLCIVLGNGFVNAMDNGIWEFDKASFRSAPKLYVSIAIGGEEIVNTRRGFKVSDYAITYDDIRCGERFDSRLLDDSLNKPYFSNRFREPLIADKPKGEYKKCCSDPVRFNEEIAPVRIIKNNEGYIYDFGKVCAGVCKLKIDGRLNQKIDMYFSEMISDNKIDMSAIAFNFPPKTVSVKDYVQHDEYICVDGKQEYIPSFTYHGFRYCFIRGITDKQATKKLLVAKTISNDIKKRSNFVCSDKTINKIQQCALNSALSNFVHIITDCPQREKNGWTSEANVACEYILYNYDAINSLREWLFNIRKAQRNDGAIPGIIPTSGWGFAWGNGPQWDKIIVEIPKLMYQFTGNKEFILENIECIKKYILYMKTKMNSDGLFSYGLPDWCVAGEKGDDCGSTPVEITDSLVCIDILRKARYMFMEVQDIELIDEIKRIENDIIISFRKKYVDKYKLTFDSQTAQSMAISLGVFEEKYIKQAVDYLVEIINDNNNLLHSGVMGYKYVLNTLAENGYTDLAYKMIMSKESPSYANIINQGATGLWEKFTEYYETENGIKQKDGCERNYSLNHCAFGGVSTWFYNYIAGIKIVDNKTIVVSPKFINVIKKVKASFRNGDKSLSVKIVNNKIEINNNHFDCLLICEKIKVKCRNGKNIFVIEQ